MAKTKIKDTFDYIQEGPGKKLADFEAMSHTDSDKASEDQASGHPFPGPLHYLDPKKEARREALRKAAEKRELAQMAAQWGWRKGCEPR